MFGNLLGSQLLSPYSIEISMTIRYTKMLFCGCLALYCIFSKRFKEEYYQRMKETGDSDLSPSPFPSDPLSV